MNVPRETIKLLFRWGSAAVDRYIRDAALVAAISGVGDASFGQIIQEIGHGDVGDDRKDQEIRLGDVGSDGVAGAE